MANPLPLPGEIQVYERDYSTVYLGTRDDLIAEGLAQPGDLPGDSGGPVTSRTIERGGKKFRFSIRSRLANPTIFRVEVLKPKPAREPEPPSQPTPAQIERQQREAALRRAIDAGEDIGIIRRDSDCGTTWIGSKADLIATGICAERHFPEGRKRLAYGTDCATPGYDRWEMMAIKRGHFEYHASFDKETRERNKEVARQNPKALHEDDPERFAEKAEDWLSQLRGIAMGYIGGEWHDETSVRYDEETVAKVGAALDHALQLLQAAYPVKPRPVASQANSKARADVQFQAFIAETLKRPDTVKGGSSRERRGQ